MNLQGLIVSRITGALAVWIGNLIMKSGSGLLWNIVVGIVGGALGNWLAHLLGIYTIGLANFAVSVAGACLLIFLLRLVRHKV